MMFAEGRSDYSEQGRGPGAGAIGQCEDDQLMLFVIVTRRKGYRIELSSSDLNNKQFIWSK